MLNRKIIAPEKLKMLVLAGNDLVKEHLGFLGQCFNLIKLDLSHNHISSLGEAGSLGQLGRLEVVLLHYNKLASVEAMLPLAGCDNLTYLTCHHNPL